jgi:hypothetical protein
MGEREREYASRNARTCHFFAYSYHGRTHKRKHTPLTHLPIHRHDHCGDTPADPSFDGTVVDSGLCHAGLVRARPAEDHMQRVHDALSRSRCVALLCSHSPSCVRGLQPNARTHARTYSRTLCASLILNQCTSRIAALTHLPSLHPKMADEHVIQRESPGAGGVQLCVHGRSSKSRCKECGGKSMCEHGRRKNQCKVRIRREEDRRETETETQCKVRI